ncbi:TauD/TfdA family dioxygenase [Sphingobium sp. DEHP117]|uniref:TauD/TfdA dioxygenase family protein n=1 Tax=Sphingobium sp. DEHP117 TaxID=2993436 RepID=UPI0027D6971B|nr:TauD/TfdA family dioxygenase [Sphingobium sp. DEHP117]MDQ4420346.1 TauD/TfdA family dioxygenase [Sphingobium sp. DEHP117]
MSELKISKLKEDLPFGARVDGVGWNNINDTAVRAQLNGLFEEHGLLVFENMEPSSKMQVALSEVFGSLKDHPTKSTPRDGDVGDAHPGVIDMHSLPNEDPNNVDGLVEIDGKRLARFSPWHFDHCYNDELNRAGVLRAAINAPEGGRTGFADGIDLYKRFPAALRDKLEKLNIIYTLDIRLTKMRFGVNFKALGDVPQARAMLHEVAMFPRAMHPAIWTRASGEKVLHIGPWMSEGIEHHEDPAGEAFFEEVCQTINELCTGNAVYWHDWRPTDMLIWDNWRLLHAVEGCDPKYERRTLRTTIKGDYGLGYFEDGKKIGEVMRNVV